MLVHGQLPAPAALALGKGPPFDRLVIKNL